jgi:hypothetical protein
MMERICFIPFFFFGQCLRCFGCYETTPFFFLAAMRYIFQKISTMTTQNGGCGKLWEGAASVGAIVGMMQLSIGAAEAGAPWTLSNALDLPDWISISGTHRTRYETLDDQFRTGRSGGDQMLAFRTTLRADFKCEGFGATAELMDSRQALADSGTPIDTTMVNALELLQAYGSVRFDDLLLNGSRSEIRFGRQTLDIGSRRLVARNSFRNTVNAFTGIYGQWQAKDGRTVRAFYFLPLNRLPSDAPSLLHNQVQFDEENFDLQFWGLHLQRPGLPLQGTGEVYVFGLHENDSARFATRNREIYTPGLRNSRGRAKGNWDYDFESVVQVGTMRNSAVATDVADHHHFAHFHHAEVGYTFDVPWLPRAAALFDYASGDGSATDNESNRFDTLFGARRFDFGPTGIYGAFARSNIESPGYGLNAKPSSTVEIDFKHRLFWLASDTDAWTTSGIRDASGGSGSFIGHQVEASVRWDLLPGNLRLELGGAHLFAGNFLERAPNAAGKGDTTYGYASLELRF